VPASSIRIFDLLWDIFLHPGMWATAVRARIVIIGENDTQYKTFVGLSGIADVLDLTWFQRKRQIKDVCMKRKTWDTISFVIPFPRSSFLLPAIQIFGYSL
uniref:hypothetical protein n=1 Tax=Faecalibaculum rodentium TaxID=1702221 RepID=UPI0026EFE231